jgi:HSP20 family protein
MNTVMATEGKKKGQGGNKSGTPAPVQAVNQTLARMREEFDRFLNRFHVFEPGTWFDAASNWRWDVKVEDTGEAVVIRAEAPGFEAGDFDIKVQDGGLTIRASKKCEGKKEEGSEYRECEYYQAVAFPTGISKDNVDATYHNGVLTITAPKTPESLSKKVTVKST